MRFKAKSSTVGDKQAALVVNGTVIVH